MTRAKILLTAWLIACTSLIGTPIMASDIPPAVERDPALHQQLETAYTARGRDYLPRTKLLDGDRARYVNRLIREASPYLLQHAHNPVDWRPWSDETLAEAQARDMPIFLSIGYATCHWCHVMEEESFDNEDVARLLNTHFISIQIDREQHPQLDHLYINATQIQQGHAGWPNSLFLMPDGRPFHTATYLPEAQFTQIVAAIGETWQDPARRPEVEEIANNLSNAVRHLTQMRSDQSAALGDAVFDLAAAQLLEMHNALEGGFSQSQQFPQEGYLLFLLDHWRRTGDDGSLTMVLETLDAIVAGGLHDHVGGGFHRYATDPNWRTPHFEKMLYNQAQLARILIEAWEITGTPAYRRAAERAFTYVARDMTDPKGAFYAAEDADSQTATGELEEGAFYVFQPDEVRRLGLADSITLLGLEEPPTLHAGNVVHLEPRVDQNLETLDQVLETLRKARESRPRPLRDTKIIAGWNGLMIRALSDGAVALQNPDLLTQAERAAATIWDRLWDGNHLSRLWADGKAREEGALQDYAWLGLAYSSLFDATGNSIWLDRAALLADAIETRFADDTGRLKMASADGPLGPIYDSSDDATPSGESSALELLARLARRQQSIEHETQALSLRGALSGPLAEQPLLRTDALLASRILDSGGSGMRRAMSKGTVFAQLLNDHLRLRIAPGWHVNAHEPGQDWLIGANLTGAAADWPEGHALQTGFTEQSINVYDGAMEIPIVPLQDNALRLTLQVCSDEVCLEPETATFRLP
ncbi:MAG: DUF255 domain-containing protein [Pseudomonadota bacterium]